MLSYENRIIARSILLIIACFFISFLIALFFIASFGGMKTAAETRVYYIDCAQYSMSPKAKVPANCYEYFGYTK